MEDLDTLDFDEVARAAAEGERPEARSYNQEVWK